MSISTKKIRHAIKEIGFNTPIIWKILADNQNLKKLTKVKGVKNAKSKISFDEALDEALIEYKVLDVDAKKIKREIIKYGWLMKFSPQEYLIYDFANKTKKEIKGFISRVEKDERMIETVGLGDEYNLLHDKYKFYQRFKAFFKRDCVCLTVNSIDEVKEFLSKHSKYIAKPQFGRGGLNTDIYELKDKSADEVIDEMLKINDEWVLEELIDQDERMAVLNETSVNTVRVNSTINKDGFSIFEIVLRCGKNGAVVDNVCDGGMTMLVDEKTGVVISDAIGHNDIFVSSHPDTGLKFKGFQIPQYDELKSVVEQMNRLIPHYPYVGWDMALSKKGWVVVEGNWGNFMSQLIKKTGVREKFEKCFDK